MSDLRFQKLTPTSNVDLNVYEEGFEFIFSNDDIRNIAVSGPYSSGKSSLLESYKKKYPQKTFIHVCYIRNNVCTSGKWDTFCEPGERYPG